MIADFLGADALLRDSLITYIVGYAIGLIPQLLAQQIAAFLQLERQNTRCYAGIENVRDKMQETLDLCRDVVQARSNCRIHQQRVAIRRI